MYNAEPIVGELMDFLLALNSRIDGIRNNKVKQFCETINFFLQALDGYISGMLTKRSHLTDNIYERTRQYRNKSMEFERYLKLSIKPKSNIVEYHSCEQQCLLNGFGYLEENFGD